VAVKAYEWRALVTELASRYGWDDTRCHQIMWIARAYGLDSEPIEKGIADIRFNTLDNTYTLTERV
jgi:hypothetical protein